MNKKLLIQLGLKYNPFGLDLPLEGLLLTRLLEDFFWRVANVLLREGGFALVLGDPGSGKSAALRLLIDYLQRLEEVVVGVLTRPQSGIADFYREMGELFGIDIKPHNRWAGFKNLRNLWQEQIDARLVRPVLLVDEAQQVQPEVLSELRALSSTRLDSRVILGVVLAGDSRLVDLLRRPELVPLASRIRFRLPLEPIGSEELMEYSRHLLSQAGNAKLMTPELMQTLADHSHGNLRLLVNMANELLTAAARQGLTQLDEKLFLSVFNPVPPSRPTGGARALTPPPVAMPRTIAARR